MHRARTLLIAALTTTSLLALVSASTGAPIPVGTTIPAPPTTVPRSVVLVPKVAPLRPVQLPVLAGRLIPATTATTKPTATATTAPTTKPTSTATTAPTTAPTSTTTSSPSSSPDAGTAAAGPSTAPAPTKAVATLSSSQKSAFVARVNSLRASLGASSMQTIAWDDNLAAFATNVASQCQLAHSSASDRVSVPGWSGTYVGENLAAGSPASLADATDATKVSADLDAALNMWWGERSSYDYATNMCASGQVCGHFTQVAWAQTSSIGCAVVMCSPHASFGNAYSVVCEFGPGGNYAGQRPY